MTNRQGEPQNAAEAWEAFVRGLAYTLGPVIRWIGRHRNAFVVSLFLYLAAVAVLEVLTR